MTIKFDNKEELILDVFDTHINKKILSIWDLCKQDNLPFYYQTLARSIGRLSNSDGDTNAPLNKIRKGFKLTGISPPVPIENPLSIQDLNIIHRTFTNAFKENRYNVQDLQLINHGAHEYESMLATPNYIQLDDETDSDTVLGYNVYKDIAKYTIDVTPQDKVNLPTNADVYFYDECRIGRSFSDAWCQDDDPKFWDIRDVDRVGPLLLFQNASRKKLYNSDKFYMWLQKYQATNKIYSDIPFANIIQGDYSKILKAQVSEFLW